MGTKLPVQTPKASDTAYKYLGMAVWKAGRLYTRRRYGHLMPSRRAAFAAIAGVGVIGAVASFATHKGTSDES